MADLLVYSLCSLADVKETLGIDAGNTSRDNLIKRMINRATDEIESYCQLAQDHHLKETTYTDEEFSGTGTNELILRARPATVSAFSERDTRLNEGSFGSIDSELYFINEAPGVIECNFTLDRWWKRYRVTYVAGYATIPSDLAEACATIASFYVDNPVYGTGIKKKQEGSRSVEYQATASTSDSMITQLGLESSLSRYVNLTFMDDR